MIKEFEKEKENPVVSKHGNYDLRKDGWYYTQDCLQRWRYRANGTIQCESVPQGPTLAQQQFKDDCDVNVILERILKTGHMPTLFPIGVDGDFTDLPSYAEALDTLNKANDSFMALPAKIRGRFENDPQKLMDFLANPENNEESYTLGLRVKPTPQAPDPILTELQTLNKNLSAKKSKGNAPDDSI